MNAEDISLIEMISMQLTSIVMAETTGFLFSFKPLMSLKLNTINKLSNSTKISIPNSGLLINLSTSNSREAFTSLNSKILPTGVMEF